MLFCLEARAGGQIAFFNLDEIYIMNADGTNVRNLTNNPAYDTNPSISADGKRIAFVSNRDSAGLEIYLMNIDGSNVTRLTNNSKDDYNPTFSPDGRIAFISDRNLQSDLYIMNSDGTNQTRLTSTFVRLSEVDFSPDGTRIAFVDGRDGDVEIYVINPDGSDVRRLTNNQDIDTSPSFSPDGARIAFRTNRDAGGNPEIYLMNSDGTNPVRITTNGSSSEPSFSPDGSQIAFVNVGDGNIYSMDVDGSNQTRLTKSQGQPDWGPLATTPVVLWAAGRDLLANEKPDRAAEANAINATVPEWSYGYRSIAASTNLTLFPPAIHVNGARGIEGFDGWLGASEGSLLVNTKSEPIILNFGFGNLKPFYPQQMYLHPSSSNFMVARWTAPATGDYRFVADWLDLDNHGGNGGSGHVVINGTEVFVREFNNDGRARTPATTRTFQAGEFIDFVLGSRGDFTFDATAFNAVVAPVAQVTLNAPAAVNEGEDVTVTASVIHPYASITGVELWDKGEFLGRDDTAPYEFTLPKVKAGILNLEARATDTTGAEGVSALRQVAVAKPGASAQERAIPERTAGIASSVTPADSCLFCFFSAFDYVFGPETGDWENPDNWASSKPGTIPGENDTVLIGASVVTLNGVADVRGLYLLGTKIVGGPQSTILIGGELTMQAGDILVNGQLTTQASEIASTSLFFNTGAKFTNFEGDARFTDVDIQNNGKMIISGKGRLVSTTTKLVNKGEVTLVRPPGSDRVLELLVDEYVQDGGRTVIAPGTRLVPGTATSNGGQFVLSAPPTRLVGNDGSSFIGNDGGTLIGIDGSTLVGNDGSSLIGIDGSTLIGLDGSTMVAAGSLNLIPPRGLRSDQVGNTITGAAAGPGPGQTRREAATAAAPLVFNGGTISGNGNLVGDVLNRGAFFAPGLSAGVLRVSGNYTQEADATLLLEIGGTQINPPQFDQFQVTQTATLGGNLIVRTINDYTPAAGDTLSPLLYANHTGSFASVSSNAQISFGANGAQVNVTGPNPPAPKALNIATRMKVETGDNALIAGFIITGSQPKKVIIRGIGPSLPFGGVLANPTLNLDNGAVTNDNWRTDQEQEIIATTIPPSNNLESAIVATLSPGPHTAILRGQGGATGIGVVEVYDLDSGAPAQLANISSRGFVQAGDDVMIGGFIIGGNYPANVLIRAIGPSLPFSGKLENPTLELVDQNGGRISNDNWRGTQEAEIIATTIPPANDNEAAILATLVPGQYTAIVRGKDNTTGIAVVEAYNLQ